MRFIKMKTHAYLDYIGGILLIAFPWLFNFADHVYLPHLLIGIGETGASLMTKKSPPP